MRRLKVRFGEKTRGAVYTHSGLTSDLSSTGMFVSTSASVAPGTRLHVEVTTSENQAIFFEAVVARQVNVPPELRTVMKAGFGLRFLTGTELLSELAPSIKDRSQLHISYESVTILRDAWERELKRGGAFCWADRSYPLNSIVTVEFDLPFAGRRLAFEARVVHQVPEQHGKHGLAFMFLDVANASAALESLLH
jgi:hypothetical protein